MRVVTDIAYVFAAIAISPLLLYRIIHYGRYRTGWAQRFGSVARRRPEKKCVWLHAVSVGEVNAARGLVEQLHKDFPDYEIIISVTTDTGFARAKAVFGNNHTVFFFPLDISWFVRRAFKSLKPGICLLMELEVWPNFVRTAYQLNIPVVVVNGRISDRSLGRYELIKPLIKSIFDKVALVLAQTEQYAQRFRQLGAADEKVAVTGSLKYDTAQITDKVAGADELAKEIGLDNGRLWVAGATGIDEEQILLDVYKSLRQQQLFADLRLAIIPRKPERFDEVAQIIKNAGFPVVRYSLIKAAAGQSETGNRKSEVDCVILGDTMGDLRKFYSLATVVFVGRSLVPMGGSDMMEAAALGKCTLFGPHAYNFKQTVDELLAYGGAILVKDKQELLESLQKCLKNPNFAAEVARKGREVIRKNQGATAKTVAHITGLLKK